MSSPVGDGLQEGSFPNSFSRGVSTWLAEHWAAAPGPCNGGTIYVSFLTSLLHRFSLSQWYHIASLSNGALLLFVSAV